MMKIKLGISSCLLGFNVRYDGGHKLDCSLRDTLGAFIEYVPVCPEVECGLGVPRESLLLEGEPDNPRLVTTGGKQDRTDLLVNWARKRVVELEVENLCGFVFKRNSPSCGITRVTVYNNSGMAVKTGIGIFAGIFIKHFSRLPVEDEGRLQDSMLREHFLERIFALKR
jgi:uncharacterized protein YbbK (DUF523 family)